ncbi:hypothetical protein NEOLI_002604 [Neolecta irregularis DAH-3]|uniref:Uncharacterized protein n=1 Tax=Neolecta irregularis (strain DAH-3) TaxID=1198029 RepID=A0A1U7LVY4_NEOID|nr:hypothetical protein NEOLI_002604 [Neolecta irregularis DAH-3]|eukprot:OLL26671.1 hypothetical protein NEOLI_002604 [Neolecta irregularis DAH-3]
MNYWIYIQEGLGENDQQPPKGEARVCRREGSRIFSGAASGLPAAASSEAKGESEAAEEPFVAEAGAALVEASLDTLAGLIQAIMYVIAFPPSES